MTDSQKRSLCKQYGFQFKVAMTADDFDQRRGAMVWLCSMNDFAARLGYCFTPVGFGESGAVIFDLYTTNENKAE